MTFIRIQIAIALRSIFRHRRRYTAAIVMSALAYTSLVLIAGYRLDVEMHIRTINAFGARKGHVTVYRAGGEKLSSLDRSSWGLTDDDLNLIKKASLELGGVNRISSSIVTQAKLTNGCESVPVLITGVEASAEKDIVSDPAIDRWAPDLRKAMFPLLPADGLEPLVATMGVIRALGKESALGKKIDLGALIPDCDSAEGKQKLSQDPFVQVLLRDQRGGAGVADLSLLGRVESGNILLEDVLAATTNNALIGASEIQDRSYVSIWLDSPRASSDFATKLQEKLSVLAPGRIVAHDAAMSRLNLMHQGMINWLVFLEVFVHVLVALAVGCVVFNFQIIASLERRNEVGVMRALGFQGSFVARILGLESVFSALFAIILGVFVSLIMIAIINHSDFRYYPPGISGSMKFHVMADVSTFLSRATVMIVVTVVTSVFVAWYECHVKSLATQLSVKP